MEFISSIDNLLEVFELLYSTQNGSELCVIYSAVVKYYSVYESVKMLKSFGQSVALSDAQRVALQAERLLVDVVEHWQDHVLVLLALHEVLELGVVLELLARRWLRVFFEHLVVSESLFKPLPDLLDYILLLFNVLVE